MVMSICSIVFHSRRKTGLYIPPSGGVFAVSLSPNLLRKVVKVEGTEEEEEFQFHPSFLILINNVLTDV